MSMQAECLLRCEDTESLTVMSMQAKTVNGTVNNIL